MFRWLPLVWANLRRRKLRLVFTFISILLAFLMFGMLDALRTSLSQAVNLAGADRLMLQSKVNITVSNPRSHYEKVKAVPGVRAVAPFNWFGGVYKDSKQQIQVQATDPEEFMKVYPEVHLKPEELAAWKNDRQAIVIGQALADQYGWKIGQRIPLRSDIWRKTDGTDTWEFNIVGIYTVEGSGWDKRSAMFQYDYFNESLQFGKDLVGWMVIKVANPDDSEKVATKIDAMFANSSNETKTATERVFIKQFLDQVGNIGLILVSVTSAVFFTMLLVTANTMAQSVRERTNEIGVLKTLGFSGQSILGLVLRQGLTLTGLGAVIGLAGGALASRGLVTLLFNTSRFDLATYAGVATLLVLVALLACWVPACRAARVDPTIALRDGV